MVFKFTIDKFLNPYIPRNCLDKSPKLIQRFGGKTKREPVADYLIWLEIFVGSFSGILLLEGVFRNHTVFSSHNAPIVIASYGATAILCFNASQAPLAQPRNILFGHFLSSLVGVCIQKLFSLSSSGRDNYWVSGGLSVALASVLMSIANCVHPPAGASALLPSIDDQIRKMSWWYLPAHLVSSVLIICVALITGNVFRSYPVYWWSPEALGRPKVTSPFEKKDEESQVASAVSTEDSPKSPVDGKSDVNGIEISSEKFYIPSYLKLSASELDLLSSIQKRIIDTSH